MPHIEKSFYVTGGTLRPDAPSYVERRADQELYEGLRRGEFCYALTSRQMGKSSLMVRTVQRLRQEGVAVAVLDLTAVGQNLSVEQWYDGLMSLLGQQLDLEDELLEFWRNNERWGPLQRSMAALEKVVLPQVRNRAEAAQRQKSEINLVIFVDEIDVVRSLPFSTDEFFAAIRECYNRRSRDAEFNRLAFCLLGVATPTDLIRETRMTPFNVGLRIELNDFTEAEAAPLAKGLSADEQLAPRLLQRVLHWTSGHPYLTQRLCRAVAENKNVASPTDVDRLCEELFLSSRARERDDNLIFVRERLLHSEADLAAMLTMYAQVHKGKRAADDEANPLVSILRLSGVTKGLDGRLRVRNRIYERVFDRDWITVNMPAAELRRQKSAFRRGIIRATAVGVVVLALIFGLTYFALQQPSLNLRRQLPDGTTLTLERTTYGKQHFYKRIVFQFPWPIPVLQPVGGTTTHEDTLCLWFSRRDPSTGKYVNANFGLIKTYDEHGCQLSYNNGGGNFTSGSINVQGVPIGAFPRRQKEFKVRLFDLNGNLLTDFMVPVPPSLRGPFQILVPEPLPITKRDGELALTLKRVTARPIQGAKMNNVPIEGFRFEPYLVVPDNGRPTDEWSSGDITMSDATGNVSDTVGLCPYEPALKFRVKFYRDEHARFASNETWTVRNIPLPNDGAVNPLTASATVQGVRIDLLAFGGIGTVTYTNAAASYIQGSGSGSGSFEDVEYSVNRWKATREAPEVITVKATGPHLRVQVTGLGEDQRVMLIARDDQGRSVNVGGQAQISPEKDRYWFMKVPAGAKAIDFTFAVHGPRIFEFVTKPPPPPPQAK